MSVLAGRKQAIRAC